MKTKDTKVIVVEKTAPKKKTTPMKNAPKKSPGLHDGQLRQKNCLKMSGPYMKTKDTTEGDLREEGYPKAARVKEVAPVFMAGSFRQKN